MNTRVFKRRLKRLEVMVEPEPVEVEIDEAKVEKRLKSWENFEREMNLIRVPGAKEEPKHIEWDDEKRERERERIRESMRKEARNPELRESGPALRAFSEGLEAITNAEG
ncbi:hypothetical protein ACFL4G_03695 [Thermodesulfobacteriota bacterium]